MILNAKSNNFLISLPQDFFNKDIDKKYEKYYRNLIVPYRSVSDFMVSTIQTIDFPGFSSTLKHQVRVLGKLQESQSAVPVADQFTREIRISFSLKDGWLNYFIFLDNLLNYLDSSKINSHNTKNSLGQALSVSPAVDPNHPVFGPIRLTILNNEGYALMSVIFNRPMLKGLSDFKLSYGSIRPEFKVFTATFQYYNFDIEPEFD